MNMLKLAVLMITVIFTGNLAADDLAKTGRYTPIMAYKSKHFYDLQGKRVAFDQYIAKGKWVVVMIWAADCHVCNQEIEQYKALHKRIKKRYGIVLGITVDGWSKRKKAFGFVKKHKVNFPTLLIEREKMPEFFRPIARSSFIGTPTFMIFSRNGEYRGKQAGAIPANIIEKFIVNSDKKKPFK